MIDPFEEVQEICSAIKSVEWSPDKVIVKSKSGKDIAWQEAYNRLFQIAFEAIGEWETSPILCQKPMHKGDFLKKRRVC